VETGKFNLSDRVVFAFSNFAQETTKKENWDIT